MPITVNSSNRNPSEGASNNTPQYNDRCSVTIWEAEKMSDALVLLCNKRYDQGRVSDSSGEEGCKRRFVALRSIQVILMGFSRGTNNVIGSRSPQFY